MAQILKYLTKAEAKKLRNAVRDHGNFRDVALFEILLGYGSRASELGLLKVEDISLEENTIVLPRVKGGRVNVWPILDRVEEALRDYLKTLNTQTSYVFPGRNFKGISRKQVWKLMRKYGDLAGLPREKQHPHSCRHYAGVNALEAGLPIEQVQDLLGHKNITSTMIYAQITASLRKEATNKLNKYS